jgi:hypothetical protein
VIYEPSLPSSDAASSSKSSTHSLSAFDDLDLPFGEKDSKHREGKGQGRRTKSKESNSTSDWKGEKYEHQNLIHVDDVFLKFQDRISRNPSQIIRHDHSGVPIPFSSRSSLYQILFPLTNPSDSSSPRKYDPSSIPPCRCDGERVFELQLMPALIPILEKSLRNLNEKNGWGHNDPEERTVEWGTVAVWVCGRDCCTGEGNKEGWKEEVVKVWSDD